MIPGIPEHLHRYSGALQEKAYFQFVGHPDAAVHLHRLIGNQFYQFIESCLGQAGQQWHLLGRVIHWPTLHARAQAQHEAETTGQPHAEPYPDVEAFKKATLEALAGSLPKMPRPMIEGMLKTMGPQLKSESTDEGLTKVTFPPMFRSMVVVVGEIDGAWHLVRMPGKPE